MAAPDPTASLIPFKGGWEAHRHRHCVWVVSPDDYPHSRVFDEVAESVEAAFAELGGSAPVVRDPADWNGRVPIIFGPHLLPSVGVAALPEGSILYNLEQVDLQHSWFNEHYLSLLSRYPVLDYSARNRDALQQIGMHHARLLEIGYSSKLTRIPTDQEKDIDLLFYGAVSKRRADILEEAQRRGLRLVTLFGVYGEERDAAIARAKVVLNMRQHRTNILETVRISYLLSNQACVVSEGDAEDPDVQPFLGGLEVVPYDLLVDRCVELVQDEARRAELARTGFDRIRARPQSHLLARRMLSEPASVPDQAEAVRIVISNRSYGAERVSADGVHFRECSFEGTTIAYRGGASPNFENCRLEGVNFSLAGPAMNTAAFLKMLMDQKIITGL